MAVIGVVHLKENETVIRVIRHYPLVYLWRFLLALFLISAPFFFMIPLFAMKRWGAAIFGLSFAVGCIYGLRVLVTWYWNAFVVTDRRIVDIDQRGFFDRVVSEAAFDKIQDVSYRVKGFWGTFLRFGSLVIQTAGTATNLELKYVHDPKDAHHLITEAVNAFHGGPVSGASGKVSALLEAAASLTDAEAKAFIVELKQAVSSEPPPPSSASDSEVGRLMGSGGGEDATGDAGKG